MIALVLAAALALAPAPHAHRETVVTVVDDDAAPVVGATLTVVHRPGLPSEKEVGAGITDSRGRVRWTPKLAGPAVLYAGKEPVGAFHVAHPYPPPSVVVPLVLLVLAGATSALYGAGILRRRT